MPSLLDRAPITTRKKDARGFMTAQALVSRTGVQRYTREELGLAGKGVVGVLAGPAPTRPACGAAGSRRGCWRRWGGG
jgi:hypothetical protein